VHACVIDEASRFKEDSWFAIRSTLAATRGPVRIIGNVKGKKNWFYRLARRAETGSPDMAYHRLTAYDAIEAHVLDAAEIADAKATLPEHVFRELFLAEASEDEGNPFGIEAINACLSPMSAHQPTAWGWDLARKQDWTVGIGLDARGVVCKFHRFRKPWHETTEFIRREVGMTAARVDETGVGDPIVEGLKRGGSGRPSCSNLEGYRFTGPSKQMLMEQLALAIHGKTVRFPEGPIATELRGFEFEYTRMGVRYAAPDGQFDDCVCALALAIEAKARRKYGSYDSSMKWVG
jgi:phage FluMu gp28-like protein